MIRYSLVCEHDHEFDGWFGSSRAYEEQAEAGRIVCPQCGSSQVHKALMAPSLSGRHGGGREEPPSVPPGGEAARLQALARRLREEVRAHADYVGERFPEEARRRHRAHDTKTESRGIYGEASREEVRDLIEEGVPVLPLPTLPEDLN